MPLDIAYGIFLAMLAGRFFHRELGIFLISICVLFSLLPDSDYLIHLLRGNNSKNAHWHRDLFHVPLLFIPIGAALLYPFGWKWPLLFCMGALAHFIHDSIGIGWGVQWLRPFRDEHYSFFYIYRPPGRAQYLPRKWFYAWPHRDIEALAARYGDPDWIKNIYFKFHPISFIEYLSFAAAIAALIFWH